MTNEPLVTAPIGTTAPAAGTTPTAPGARAGATPEFCRILESLERLARQHRQPPPVDDAEQLQQALQRADHDFTTAMDLRRRLEDAFRGRQ